MEDLNMSTQKVFPPPEYFSIQAFYQDLMEYTKISGAQLSSKKKKKKVFNVLSSLK